MHPSLCYRQSGNICWGGYLEEEAAGTPLPRDHAQRKRGWCLQLFRHAEQTLQGWLLFASVLYAIPVPVRLTSCPLCSDPQHLRVKSEWWCWHHLEKPGTRNPHFCRFSWGEDSSVSPHHPWHDGLSQQVTSVHVCMVDAETWWLKQMFSTSQEQWWQVRLSTSEEDEKKTVQCLQKGYRYF